MILPLLTAGAVTLLVLGHSPLKGIGRVLSPTGLSLAILLSIFTIRPMLARSSRDYSFYGYDASPGREFALRVGIVALASFGLGVAAGRGKARVAAQVVHSVAEPPPQPSQAYRMRAFAFGLLGPVLYVICVYFLGGREAVGQLIGGRSATLTVALAGLPTIFQSLTLTGAAAACVHIAAFPRRLRDDIRFILLLTAPAVLSNLTLGNRRFLLPAVLAPVIAVVFVRRGKVPRSLASALAASLFLLATIPFIRSAGARRPGENLVTAAFRYLIEGGPAEVVRGYFLSYDTEMFNYVAVVGPRLGDAFPYGWGRGTLVEFLSFPFPTGWTGDLRSDALLIMLFGGTCATHFCPVPSLPGVMLLDFGWVGAAAGLFCFGYAMRRLERGVLRTQSSTFIALAAGIGAYSPVMMRTYTVHAVWWLIYFSVLVLLAAKLLPSVRRVSGAPDMAGV